MSWKNDPSQTCETCIHWGTLSHLTASCAKFYWKYVEHHGRKNWEKKSECLAKDWSNARRSDGIRRPQTSRRENKARDERNKRTKFIKIQFQHPGTCLKWRSGKLRHTWQQMVQLHLNGKQLGLNKRQIQETPIPHQQCALALSCCRLLVSPWYMSMGISKQPACPAQAIFKNQATWQLL